MVHPSLYNYNAYPQELGRSLEMGYGRLNGFASLLLVGMEKASQSPSIDFSIHSSASDNELLVFCELPPHVKDATFVVTDILGRELMRQKIAS
jgi:hypothetical protein